MKIKHILVISLLCLVIGYQFTDFFLRDILQDLPNNIADNIENPGQLFFFKNNIMFFLIVSVLPFINIILLCLQLFLTGSQVRLIINLDIISQFNILYRHLIFEFTALILSVYVSYLMYDLLRQLHRKEFLGAKEKFYKMVKIYSVILLTTIIAAILEGSFNA